MTYGKKIKKIVLEIFFTGLIIFAVSNFVSYLRRPKLESNLLPKQHFILLDGTSYVPKIGKPLLIHFWGSWCEVCKREAKNIEAVSKKYEVITIASQSGSNASILAQMKKEGVDFKTVNDNDGKWTKFFKVKFFPTDFIYKSDGTLFSSDVGYTTTAGLFARMKLAE